MWNSKNKQSTSSKNILKQIDPTHVKSNSDVYLRLNL